MQWIIKNLTIIVGIFCILFSLSIILCHMLLLLFILLSSFVFIGNPSSKGFRKATSAKRHPPCRVSPRGCIHENPPFNHHPFLIPRTARHLIYLDLWLLLFFIIIRMTRREGVGRENPQGWILDKRRRERKRELEHRRGNKAIKKRKRNIKKQQTMWKGRPFLSYFQPPPPKKKKKN